MDQPGGWQGAIEIGPARSPKALPVSLQQLENPRDGRKLGNPEGEVPTEVIDGGPLNFANQLAPEGIDIVPDFSPISLKPKFDPMNSIAQSGLKVADLGLDLRLDLRLGGEEVGLGGKRRITSSKFRFHDLEDRPRLGRRQLGFFQEFATRSFHPQA
jgi:hypothetical protein